MDEDPASLRLEKNIPQLGWFLLTLSQLMTDIYVKRVGNFSGWPGFITLLCAAGVPCLFSYLQISFYRICWNYVRFFLATIKLYVLSKVFVMSKYPNTPNYNHTIRIKKYTFWRTFTESRTSNILKDNYQKEEIIYINPRQF